ncbi:dienelactone hydrolase family protein [Hyphococcus luteus]|uniref:Dienelactone hydrolase n=1 Tax=Hyphococcus luteus TaxID=2058213 RepID=A0A2S7JYY9_9PROT|nr:dienelactone hydrolase family protein [Marinicaulis flavus]PQA85469.1 dienelactone hydrolase [Marinicaulis flavus]
MCDERTEAENEAFFKNKGALSRRHFNAIAAGAGAAIILPAPANAMAVSEADVTVSTPDGEADAYFVHPASGKHPAVIIWPDIMGIRPAFRQMGKRLAQSGYSVLVVNPYYRMVKGNVIEKGESFADPEVRERLMPYARSLSPETQVTDTKAFVKFLDSQDAVDTKRKMGVTGYCMTGSFAMRGAAAVPDRIGAVGSFHGGGLVTDDATSPHLLIPQMKARSLIAIAENDDEHDPEAKTKLREAYDAAGLAAKIEVYEGAMHGWCPPDSRVYNHDQAEHAWSHLLTLLADALA